MNIRIIRNIESNPEINPLSTEEWIDYVNASKNLVWLECCPTCVEYNYNGVTIPPKKLALYFAEEDRCNLLLGFHPTHYPFSLYSRRY